MLKLRKQVLFQPTETQPLETKSSVMFQKQKNHAETQSRREKQKANPSASLRLCERLFGFTSLKSFFQKLNRPTVLRPALTMLVVLLVMLTATELLACPTCKDGIAENDPGSQAQAAGYFYSILFMMAMPFLLLGSLGGAAYLSIRRANEQRLIAADNVVAIAGNVAE